MGSLCFSWSLPKSLRLKAPEAPKLHPKPHKNPQPGPVQHLQRCHARQPGTRDCGFAGGEDGVGGGMKLGQLRRLPLQGPAWSQSTCSGGGCFGFRKFRCGNTPEPSTPDTPNPTPRTSLNPHSKTDWPCWSRPSSWDPKTPVSPNSLKHPFGRFVEEPPPQSFPYFAGGTEQNASACEAASHSGSGERSYS